MGAIRRALTPIAVAAILTCLPAAAGAAGRAGRLDPSFGARGYATTAMTGVRPENWDLAEVSAARAPDGRLFVATGPSSSPSVVAFDAHGRLDHGFGAGGRLAPVAPDGFPLAIGGIAVDSEGRLLVAGESEATEGVEPLIVSRYLPDGSPDLSFGGLGYASTTPKLEPAPGVVEPGEPIATGVDVDPAGRIVLAATVLGTPPCDANSAFLARFNADGSADLGFGSGGYFVYLSTIQRQPENLTSTSGGLPVFSGAGGYGCPDVALSQSEPPTVERLTESGAPDTGFDGDGRVAVRDFADGLASRADGSLLVLEGFGRVTELNPDGTRNRKFDHDALADLAVHSELDGIVATPDGGALITGAERVRTKAPEKSFAKHVVLARLDRHGRLVRGFGDGGVVSTLPAGGKTQTVGEQVLLDGKGHAIVAGGLTGPAKPAAMLFLQYDLGH